MIDVLVIIEHKMNKLYFLLFLRIMTQVILLAVAILHAYVCLQNLALQITLVISPDYDSSHNACGPARLYCTPVFVCL